METVDHQSVETVVHQSVVTVVHQTVVTVVQIIETFETVETFEIIETFESLKYLKNGNCGSRLSELCLHQLLHRVGACFSKN